MVVIFLVNECECRRYGVTTCIFFCIKFGFIKKGSFFCEKDERYVHD